MRILKRLFNIAYNRDDFETTFRNNIYETIKAEPIATLEIESYWKTNLYDQLADYFSDLCIRIASFGSQKAQRSFFLSEYLSLQDRRRVFARAIKKDDFLFNGWAIYLTEISPDVREYFETHKSSIFDEKLVEGYLSIVTQRYFKLLAIDVAMELTFSDMFGTEMKNTHEYELYMTLLDIHLEKSAAVLIILYDDSQPSEVIDARGQYDTRAIEERQEMLRRVRKCVELDDSKKMRETVEDWMIANSPTPDQ